MRRYGRYGDTALTDVLAAGVNDAAYLAQQQQANAAALQQAQLQAQTGPLAWLSSTMFAGIPNWVLLAGGAAAVYLISKRK